MVYRTFDSGDVVEAIGREGKYHLVLCESEADGEAGLLFEQRVVVCPPIPFGSPRGTLGVVRASELRFVGRDPATAGAIGLGLACEDWEPSVGWQPSPDPEDV